MYTALQSKGKVIISDKLTNDKDADVQRLLGSSRIILSTLGMLSNPVLHLVGLFLTVPVERLVVDEASQIKMEEFMVCIPSCLIQPSLTIQQHIFVKFSKTLRKVSFFGDPEQRQEIIPF